MRHRSDDPMKWLGEQSLLSCSNWYFACCSEAIWLVCQCAYACTGHHGVSSAVLLQCRPWALDLSGPQSTRGPLYDMPCRSAAELVNPVLQIAPIKVASDFVALLRLYTVTSVGQPPTWLLLLKMLRALM